MNLSVKTDLWTYLTTVDKPILMYGMGNGADKILRVCETYGIEIADFFASDGFVRGHSFHGKTVLSYTEARAKHGDCIVLLSFASSLPDVLETIHRIADEVELYAPDVPVFGDNLFNMEFFRRHEAELDEICDLLADETSRATFRALIEYKLSGNIAFLDACESDEEEVTRQFVCPENVKNYVDLGAYNGDTIRKLAPLAPALDRVLALEPDRRNFRKLSEYAESVRDHLHITPLQLAAWDHEETLMMDASGNRNANVSGGGKKVIPVAANALDHVIGDLAPDFIKYDVEGSEHEALIGSAETIRRNAPRLLVSLYHRSEDLFALPQLIRQLYPQSKLYLRKLRYIPAWDINLYVIPDGAKGRNENV